ncbi:tetratricopeptide repeat protein [Paraburkholderia sp. EG287B]|uniref:tetratricopeptide repeat protein n=1 Tax=Paraburkholderia sp. EG287B TaxID=3237010 RepID=UPI0034D2EA88
MTLDAPILAAKEAAALIEAGLACHRAGRVADAHAYYQSALAAHPENPGALHYLGVIALGRGQLQEAADLMDRALAQTPDGAEYLANRGVVANRLATLRAPRPGSAGHWRSPPASRTRTTISAMR